MEAFRFVQRRAKTQMALEAALHSDPDDPPAVEAPTRLEWATQTRNAMGTLPTVQREVLELSYFAHLSQSDIAIRLGVSVEFVKASAAIALQQIANRIATTELA